MSDFGVRIGKVLAAFGLCMALFCVPAGADVKEELSAIDKAIKSTREQLKYFEDENNKYILEDKKFLSILFSIQEKLFWIRYYLNYVWYNNNDSNIDNDIYTARLNMSSLETDFNNTKYYLEISLRMGLARAYFEKNWMPYQVTVIITSSLFMTTGFNSKFDTTSCEGYDYEGVGIAIWNKRAPQLKAYAEKKGEDWQDLKTQLDFFQQELETIAPKEVARLRNSKTQEEAYKAFKDFVNYYNTIK